MKNLSKNWITEKLIDFEYKKYLLLAYLQEVDEVFSHVQLYPAMADLVAHYRNLMQLKENKTMLYNSFPERLSKTDFQNFNLVFNKIIEDDNLMKEIESIIDFSIPEMERHLNEGKKIFGFIEENLHIAPLGVLPLNPIEGYLLIRNGKKALTEVYEYQVSIFDKPDERYRGLYANPVKSYERSLTNTYEYIRSDLIRHNKKLPTPATYVIESELFFPMYESFLPVAKRSFIKYLSDNFLA